VHQTPIMRVNTGYFLNLTIFELLSATLLRVFEKWGTT